MADVHTPYPVHGLAEAMGLPESRIGGATLLGGLTGLGLAAALAFWTHTTDWPLDVGGKDDLAWQGVVPVMFEVTVLLAGLATVLGLFLRTRLWPRLPVGTPPSQPDPRVTDDRFAVLVREHDGSFRRDLFLEIATRHAAVEIVEGWRVRG